MFDTWRLGNVTEYDTSGASVARRSGVDVCRELDPAVAKAGVVELERMLAQAASHRQVSPGWPAPGSLWAGFVPGPELAKLATERLADPKLTQGARLDCIDAITRSINALQGIRADAIAAFVKTECRENVGGVPMALKSAQAELEFLVKLSPTAAHNLLNRSVQLQSLPMTRAALLAGAISEACAHAVVEETALLDGEQKRAVEERVFPDAGTHTEPKLKREVRTAIAELDPELVRKRHEEEKKRQDVRLSTSPFGMSRITAYLTAADAQAIYGVTKAHAKTLRGDGRPFGQRKADAFKEFFLGSTTKPKPRVSTQIRVVIPAGTALGLTDEAGYLAGYGAIPADMARELAKDGTWRRLLTDPVSGEILDYGTTRYRPPKPLVERVRARDGECDAPECVMAAHECDLDHEIPHHPDGTGGTTSESNLRARCQHHHDVKGLPGWKVRTNRDGTTTWTTPNGRTYLSKPARFTPKRR